LAILEGVKKYDTILKDKEQKMAEMRSELREN
jgi:hypothetical protein